MDKRWMQRSECSEVNIDKSKNAQYTSPCFHPNASGISDPPFRMRSALSFASFTMRGTCLSPSTSPWTNLTAGSVRRSTDAVLRVIFILPSVFDGPTAVFDGPESTLR